MSDTATSKSSEVATTEPSPSSSDKTSGDKATSSAPITQKLTAAQVAGAGPQVDWRKLNNLRSDQREIASRIALFESELSETKLVTEALMQVDSKRDCFRLEGGVLVKHLVSDVLVSLEKNKEFVEQMVDGAKKEMTEKGKHIQKFLSENNLALRKPTVQ